MENSENYLTDVHRDLISLANYHSKIILFRHEHGNIDADDNDRLKMLADIPHLVQENIEGKKKLEATLKKTADRLMRTRLIASCPECKTDQTVTIIDETTNVNFGWKLDIVECAVCSTEFTNYWPNNWHDRMKFQDNFFNNLFEIGAEGKTMAEEIELDEPLDMKKGYEQYLSFKKAHYQAEKAVENLIFAFNKSCESLESLRDYLFMAKIKGDYWSPGDIES